MNTHVKAKTPDLGNQEPPASRSVYREGNYAPTLHETDASPIALIEGAWPQDLNGIFVRNGANPRFTARGRHHWFDGDGMLHAVQIQNGTATYRNRWIRTEAFLAESEAGHSLWTGATERPDLSNPRGPLKDTSNTDVVFHGGRLLSTWYLSGKPYSLSLPHLDTDGPVRFGSMQSMSAHPKVDPVTGDMIIFDYKPHPPYFTVGVVSAQGELIHKTEIAYPGPRLQHDIAITEKHTILMDLSMMWDPELLKKGQTRVTFLRDKPTRFGVLPRFGSQQDVRWFETEACFMYHTINAWEEGDDIVLIGCRIDHPLAADPLNPKGSERFPTIGFLRLEPYVCRWRMNLRSGRVTTEILDDVPTEFPRMDNRVLGRPSRYSFNPRLAKSETLLFDGLVAYDLRTGASVTYSYPKGCFGGELVFCPRDGQEGARSRDDADGYLTTIVAEEATGQSEFYVFDAKNIELGPVARGRIAERVPTGFHAWWVGSPDLAAHQSLRA